MNIVLLGAAGFIGTNITIALARDTDNSITVVDQRDEYFANIRSYGFLNVKCVESPLKCDTNYEKLVSDNDVVYHLISTTVPTTSNKHISEELNANVILSAKLIEACINKKIKRIVFISSGGTVYGKSSHYPIKEDASTYPISSYGLQKITIEKLLYLYNHIYGLDYRIIRLANPYGAYQRPNGVLGVINTFVYKALKSEQIEVYGDGSVVRDFIYIDDAVKGILNIDNGSSQYKTFNLGSGHGTSINEVLGIIQDTLHLKMKIKYKSGRNVDVPVNYLDIGRYEEEFGELSPMSIEEGIIKTADFMKQYYNL